jgi:hypothetical protein
MIYAFEVPLCGMIIFSSFMKTGTDVQEVLRFYITNFRGCNVGITDGRELRRTA